MKINGLWCFQATNLITDRSDIETDASTATALFEALQDEDCVVYAHVGGRYADIAQAHDGRLETAMEIHSAWGTFEWLLTDGFKLGHRCGVVCNSDGHKGRPGASYPGVATFGAYCYDNPESESVSSVMMGDIVKTDAATAKLNLHVNAHAPIERIEVRNGEEVVEVLRPYTEKYADNTARVRVLWSGAEYRGRGRQSNWTGRTRFTHSRVTRLEKINAWNHERKLVQNGSDTIEWDAMTTGNFGGFDVWLDIDKQKAAVDLSCNHGSISAPLT